MTAASYDACIRAVLQYEGGYTNHPADPGGPTNWGITIADARHYWKPDATKEDVRAMPLDVAKKIYRAHYWDALKCDLLPAGLDLAVFDYGVNSGISRSAKVLQAILGIPQDGQIGPGTLRVVATRNAADLIQRVCDERLAFLKRLKTWSTFGGGWGRRVASVRQLALHLAERPGTPLPAIVPPSLSEHSAKAIAPPVQTATAKTTTAVVAAVGAAATAGAAAEGFAWSSLLAVAVIAVAIAAMVWRFWPKQEA